MARIGRVRAFALLLISLLASTIAGFAAPAGTLVRELAVPARHFAVDPVRPRIYATLTSTNSVAVIDTTNLTVVKTVFIGSNPIGLAISEDGNKLFVANSGSTTLGIGVLDLQTLERLPSLPAPTAPCDIEVGLNGRLYVTPINQDGKIMQIDGGTGALQAQFDGGVFIYQGGHLAISPDRRTLYFGNSGISPASLASFDVSTATPAFIQKCDHGQVGSNGQDLQIRHRGDYLCFAVGGGQGNYQIAGIPVNDLNASLGLFNMGAYPRYVAFSPDDAVVYAGETSRDGIKYFDAETFQFLGSFRIDREHGRLAVDRSGKYLFAAERPDPHDGREETLRVYDTGRDAAVITSALTASAGQDASFSYQITATNTPTGFAVAGLPRGLSLDPATGQISGAPLEVGTFPVQLSATNAIGTAMATLMLDVGHALTVTVQGEGSVPPGFAGTTYRPVGSSVSITATPAAGHHFAGWSGSIESVENPLSFSLTEPTSIVATFAKSPPVLTNQPQVAGKIKGLLFYNITAENDPESFAAAGLPEGLSLNPATGIVSGIPQVAGVFEVSVSATNSGGTVQNTVRFEIEARLDVTSSTGGTVSPLGTTYHPADTNVTVVATPHPGYVFKGWTGSLTSTSRTLTVPVLSYTDLSANFASWSLYGGAYAGVVTPESQTGSHSGLLTIDVTSSGQFTGRITLDGVKYPLMGVFDTDSSASLAISRKNLPPLLVSLSLDASGSHPEITGEVREEGGEWTSQFVSQRGVTDAVAQAGSYTLTLDHERQDSALPGGVGYGTLKITATGAARFKGVLGDGTKASGSAVLANDGSLAFHVPLYQKKGFISGTLRLEEGESPGQISGEVHWSKPAARKGRYAAGFSIGLEATGSSYAAPPVLAGESGQILFEQGGLGSGFSESVLVTSAGKLTVSEENSRSITCKLNANSGLFSGKFKDGKKKLKFGGAFVQSRDSGAGTFVNGDITGAVGLTFGAPPELGGQPQ